MKEITPEDVAKGMIDYMTKQSGKILIDENTFATACAVVMNKMKDEDSKISSPITMLLLIDRMRFTAELMKKLFDENKKEE